MVYIYLLNVHMLPISIQFLQIWISWYMELIAKFELKKMYPVLMDEFPSVDAF